jgi:hypothetical protein
MDSLAQDLNNAFPYEEYNESGRILFSPGQNKKTERFFLLLASNGERSALSWIASAPRWMRRDENGMSGRLLQRVLIVGWAMRVV